MLKHSQIRRTPLYLESVILVSSRDVGTVPNKLDFQKTTSSNVMNHLFLLKTHDSWGDGAAGLNLELQTC